MEKSYSIREFNSNSSRILNEARGDVVTILKYGEPFVTIQKAIVATKSEKVAQDVATSKPDVATSKPDVATKSKQEILADLHKQVDEVVKPEAVEDERREVVAEVKPLGIVIRDARFERVRAVPKPVKKDKRKWA